MTATAPPTPRGRTYGPLTPEQQQLVVQHAPLALAVAGRLAANPALCRRLGDRHDVVQTAFLGLIRAVQRFDPSRGYKFSTYAQSCVKTVILDAAKGRSGRDGGHAQLLHEPAALLAPAPDDAAAREAAEDTAHRVRKALRRLDRRDRDLLWAATWGESAAQAGRRWGVSKTRVSQLRIRAAGRMRGWLADLDGGHGRGES